jgi:hypothetical protein
MNARKLTRRSGSAAPGRMARRDEKAPLMEEQRLDELRSRAVSSLKLDGLDQYAARRVKGALERRGIKTLGDLQGMSERDLLSTRDMGKISRRILDDEMRALGLPIGAPPGAETAEPGTVEFERLVSMPVDALRLPGLDPGRANMARAIWKENGLRTVGDIVSREAGDLRLKHRKNPHYGAGAGTIRALERELAGLGLRLGMAEETRRHAGVKALAMDVEFLELSIRAANCLRNLGITTVLELVARTEEGLLATKSIGPKSVNEIKTVLAFIGLSLGIKPDDATIAKTKAWETARPPEEAERGEAPYIRLEESGRLETNLSPAQLRTMVRLAKKELAELRDDIQPHRLKVIGELLDLMEEPGGRKTQ